MLYALKDYLGADTVNRILSEFIDEWGFQGPPYPTTRDLITKFRDNADPQFQSVITDLFEKIIIFDLRSEDNTFRGYQMVGSKSLSIQPRQNLKPMVEGRKFKWIWMH
ncbi:MAG: hypothetical protein CM1200mP40_28120 [Gammaproteobacteria bacterium]|nr:MAG: hypothetical protein CM1200mP40_28120 [Gammaproteobacteria bacterium]